MAEQYELSIGGDVVKVPAWATEETISKMSKYSEGTAKAMTELLRQWDSGNKVAKDNKKLFKQIAKSSQENTEENKKANKTIKDSAKKTMDTISRTSENAAKKSEKILEAFEKSSLTGLTAAIGASGLFGGAIGFAASVTEGFTQAIINLANQGVGLTASLQELRINASQSGMSLQEYSEFIVSNGDALRALGDNTNDGAQALALLSATVRDNAMRNFNMFGLTVGELNEIMVEEVNLRRMSGMNQTQIINSVNDAMTELMVQTTGLANIAGVDRRELIRERQAALNDAVIGAEEMSDVMRDNLSNFAALFSTRGGSAGSDLATAIIRAEQTGLNFQNLSESAAMMGIQAQGAIQEIADFYTQNVESMDPTQFGARILEMMGQLPDMFSASDIRQLQTMDAAGVQGARDLLELITGFRGIDGSFEEIMASMANTESQLADSENSLMALPATMQDLSNRIRASALTDVLDRLGVDVRTSGGALVQSIQNIADNFGFDSETGEFQGLLEGLRTTITDLTSESERVVAALAIFGGGIVAVNGIMRSLGMAGAGTGILNGLRGATQGARSGGLLNILRGVGSKAGLAGLGLSGIFGYFDGEREEAGYSGIDRAALGIGEDLINLGDGIVNVATQVNRLWGGDGSNNVDMSQGFRDWTLSENGLWWNTWGRLGSNPFRSGPMDTGFEPGVSGSSPGYYVPEVDNMSVRGIEWSQTAPGQVDIENIDPSVAWRFRNSANPNNQAQARRLEAEAVQFNEDVMAIMGRMQITFAEAVTELRRLRRITEESN